MKIIIIVVLLVICFNGAYGFTHCKKIDENIDYKLYWDLDTPGKVHFLIQAETAGWVGLGLSNGGEHAMISNGNMSDIWVGWVDINSAASPCSQGCLYDYYTAKYQLPTLDPSNAQSLNLISANYSEGVMSIEFTRDLSTGDNYDRVIDVDALTTFIWALNPSSRATPKPDGSSFAKHNVDTKGVVSIKLSDPSQCRNAPVSDSYSFSNPDNTYFVQWNVFENEGTVKFTITAQTKGWVGIGFSTSPNMVGSDIYVAWVYPNGTVHVTDRYATGHSMPLEDTKLGGTNDVIIAESADDGDEGVTILTFSRKLDTGDKKDVALNKGLIYALWAYGSDSSVDYATNTFSQHIAKGVVKIDIMNGTAIAAPTTDLAKVHGIVMVVSICLLLFPGILVSRYFKVLIPKWFYIHALLQTIGVVGVLCAFCIIIVAKDRTFTVGLHQMFGLFVFCGFVLEYALGIVSHLKFNPKRQTPPVFPDKVHWWFGRGVFVAACFTIFFGLRTYQASAVVQLLYGLWIGVAIVGLYFLQSMLGQTHELPKDYQLALDEMSEDGEEKEDKSKANAGDPEKYQGYKSKPFLVLYSVVGISLCLLLFASVYKSSPSAVVITPPPSNTVEVTYNFDAFVIPNMSTNYICKGFYLPNDTDYHITAFDPLKDNQEMLHHMILYETTDFFGSEYFDCGDMPKGSSPLYAWAVGGEKSVMPDNVGIRIGKTAGKYAALQIHYDNPNLWSGRTDSSGFKLTMTTKLREMDAGYFVVGASTRYISIPPSLSHYEIMGACNTTPIFNSLNATQEYTVWTAGLHMHTLGRQIYTDQYRPNPVTGELELIGTIGCEDYFSFNNQRGVPVNATLRAGDQLTLHCIYDSTSKTTTTKGCESTDCEMCLNFIIYYPKISPKAINCGSSPIISSNNVSQLRCGGQ